MTKIVGYKIKDSAYEKWIELHKKHKDICTLQEFFEYMIGVPTSVFAEYFDRNKIEYNEDFNPTIEDSANICTKIMLRNYGDLDITHT